MTTPTTSYVRGCACEASTWLSQCYPFVFAVVAEHVRSTVTVEVSNQETGATMATPFHVLVPRSAGKAAVGFGQGNPLVASAIVAEHVCSPVAVKVTKMQFGASMRAPAHGLVPGIAREMTGRIGQGNPFVSLVVVAHHVRSPISVEITCEHSASLVSTPAHSFIPIGVFEVLY